MATCPKKQNTDIFYGLEEVHCCLTTQCFISYYKVFLPVLLLYYAVLQSSVNPNYNVLHNTTPSCQVLQSSSPHYKIIVLRATMCYKRLILPTKYDKVLVRTTPYYKVLLRTTNNFSVPQMTKNFSVIQSITPLQSTGA